MYLNSSLGVLISVLLFIVCFVFFIRNLRKLGQHTLKSRSGSNPRETNRCYSLVPRSTEPPRGSNPKRLRSVMCVLSKRLKSVQSVCLIQKNEDSFAFVVCLQQSFWSTVTSACRCVCIYRTIYIHYIKSSISDFHSPKSFWV